MNLIILVGSCLIILLAIATVLKVVLIKLPQTNYSYEKIEKLFTVAERSLFGILKQVASDGIEVFGKVRVADVIVPRKGFSRSNWQRAFNKISGKHFDFLLCKESDLSIICAIELNDSSHKLISRAERDSFLLEACKSANLPLIQIPVKNSYNIKEIEALLSEFLNRKASPAFSVHQQEVATVNVPVKKCPKCSSEMVKRVAKKGANSGNEFWGCSDYPNCKYIEAIEP